MYKTDKLKHVKYLAWLYIALDILFLLIGLFAYNLLNVIGGTIGGEPIFRLISGALAIGFTVIGVAGIIVGIGLLKKKEWGRVLAIVLGVINLFNLPIGTVLGIYTLWILLDQRVADAFKSPQSA